MTVSWHVGPPGHGLGDTISLRVSAFSFSILSQIEWREGVMVGFCHEWHPQLVRGTGPPIVEEIFGTSLSSSGTLELEMAGAPSLASTQEYQFPT